MSVQPNLPLHEVMEARLSPELVGKIMREVKRGLKGRFKWFGTSRTPTSERESIWDTFQDKIWISDNSLIQPPTAPYRRLKMFYFLSQDAMWAEGWTRSPPGDRLHPHYYHHYSATGKSYKIFPILYEDSGDGPVALMDPKDPTKYLNLFIPPRIELTLLMPETTFFLNGRTGWLRFVKCCPQTHLRDDVRVDVDD
jgi:hypothetical protein